MHAPLHAALGSPDLQVAARAAAALDRLARLLDALGLGREGVLVAHVGGAHGDRDAALFRFAARYERLPERARCRLVVEHDEDSFALADLLRLHQLTCVPVVFDALHHQINDPLGIPLAQALGLALATWPRAVRPKVHFSSQRTEAHLLPARRGAEQRVIAPALGQHADFVNACEFAAFAAGTRGLPPFDVMLEAKAADMALLRLREDLRRVAPEVAGLVG
jgi:UV DNA damage endonuclease